MSKHVRITTVFSGHISIFILAVKDTGLIFSDYGNSFAVFDKYSSKLKELKMVLMSVRCLYCDHDQVVKRGKTKNDQRRTLGQPSDSARTCI